MEDAIQSERIFRVDGKVVSREEYEKIPTATKHDASKVQLELMSTIALMKIGQVLTFGARKYASHNWRRGMAWSRLLGAALRHLLAYLGGEDKDPETGLSHLAHAGCCIMFLLEYEETHKSFDDRYKGG